MIASPWAPLLWSLAYLAACVVMVAWHRRLRRWQNILQEWTEALHAMCQPSDCATCTTCGTTDLALFWFKQRDGTVLCEACYEAEVQRQGERP